MFKIGDIVEITPESSATGMMDFKDGKGYKVFNVSDVSDVSDAQSMVSVRTESGWVQWFNEAHFKLKERKVEEKEFKVGDTVVCLQTDFYELDVNDITYRKEYVVKRSNRGCIQIVKDSGELGWFDSDTFKLKEDTIVEKKECLFKEGQVVWDLIYGKGEVSNVDFLNFHLYPVCVKFDQSVTYGPVLRSYTAEGISSEFGIRSLYFSEPKIEAATEPVFEPTLEGGMTLAAVDKETSRFYRLVVSEETQEVVESVHSVVFEKELFDFYYLGEKIEF